MNRSGKFTAQLRKGSLNLLALGIDIDTTAQGTQPIGPYKDFKGGI